MSLLILLALLQTPTPASDDGAGPPVVEVPAVEGPAAQESGSEPPVAETAGAEQTPSATEDGATGAEGPAPETPAGATPAAQTESTAGANEAASEPAAATEGPAAPAGELPPVGGPTVVPPATPEVPASPTAAAETFEAAPAAQATPAGTGTNGEGTATPEFAPPPVEVTAPVPGSAAGGWQTLNKIDLIINEEPITSVDMSRAMMMNPAPATTQDDRARLAQETAQSLVSRSLKVQAGRDEGFDKDMVKRFVNDHVDRTLDTAGSAGKLADELENTHLDAFSYHDNIESRVYQDLWTGAVVGRYPGVGGRPYRDRYVRPERLEFEFERQEGRLDLPSTVILQELVCDPARTGSLESAKELAERLHEEIVAGGDFGQIAVDNRAAAPDNQGIHKPLDETAVSRIPGIGEFLATAAPGDVSEVLPVREQGVLRAWRIVKLIERDQGAAAHFDDPELQDYLRKRYQERLDGGRENEALSKLLAAAYVWPPHIFGRSEPALVGPTQEP